jgi:hypothetical protein
MPSSTSSSDVEKASVSTLGSKGYLVLLAVVALIFAGVELFTRYAFPKIDGGMRRNTREVAAALDLRPTVIPKQVLVVGNSLLDNGVLFDEVSRSLRPDIEASRLMVPDTNYYDWYYGLRRLFAEGTRPNVVVLVLSPRQLVADRIRTAYSPYHMFLAGDTYRAARKLDVSNTETSNMLFAHYSAYFGDGDEVRKGILRHILPELPTLMAKMTRNNPPPLMRDEVRKTATERLLALQELAAAYKVRFVLVVPPSGETKGDEAYLAVQLAGETAGVPVLMPAGIGSIAPELYSDKFHLNSRGAKLFTPQFADSLLRELVGR